MRHNGWNYICKSFDLKTTIFAFIFHRYVTHPLLIEIPEEFINRLEWRVGHILEINEQDNKLVIEKLHGFLGS
jgi:bifunctional DNA-binding transcriptional regulator/antitoxin component of YhaV-PrlF toxin-antitoxin module